MHITCTLYSYTSFFLLLLIECLLLHSVGQVPLLVNSAVTASLRFHSVLPSRMSFAVAFLDFCGPKDPALLSE